jgi:hypothetical protein
MILEGAKMPDPVIKKSKRGFVFVAWGEKYVQEAIRSAISIKRHMDYPICLITSRKNQKLEIFSHIIYEKFSYSYKDKILMKLSPYEETIFLDTDTFILESMDEALIF